MRGLTRSPGQKLQSNMSTMLSIVSPAMNHGTAFQRGVQPCSRACYHVSMDNDECVSRLRKKCRELGGDLVEVTPREYREMMESPKKHRSDGSIDMNVWSDAPFSSNDLGI